MSGGRHIEIIEQTTIKIIQLQKRYTIKEDYLSWLLVPAFRVTNVEGQGQCT